MVSNNSKCPDRVAPLRLVFGSRPQICHEKGRLSSSFSPKVCVLWLLKFDFKLFRFGSCFKLRSASVDLGSKILWNSKSFCIENLLVEASPFLGTPCFALLRTSTFFVARVFVGLHMPNLSSPLHPVAQPLAHGTPLSPRQYQQPLRFVEEFHVFGGGWGSKFPQPELAK